MVRVGQVPLISVPVIPALKTVVPVVPVVPALTNAARPVVCHSSLNIETKEGSQGTFLD